MFGHHHVADHHEAVLAAYLFQNLEEQVSRTRAAQKGMPKTKLQMS